MNDLKANIVCLVAITFAALAAGCGAASDEAGESSDQVTAAPTLETFRLFTPDGQEPGPYSSCAPAMFTSLTLEQTPSGLKGVFNEGTPFPDEGESAASSGFEVPWPCEAVFVIRDYFEYRLTRQPGECGTTVYVSTGSTPDGSTIKIVDHRKDTCPKGAAALEIEETHGGNTKKLIGRDLPVGSWIR
jgi:hypothetical protein